MTDILLIQPPIEDFYLTAKRTLPYGLACIAAALRQSGFTVSILDGLATAKSRTMPWPGYLGFLHPYYGRADITPFALFHKFRHYGFSYEHIAKTAKASGAFLIGISSLFTAYSRSALRTAEKVKAACPGAVIVLGGHHPTALALEVLGHPAVDFVLRGDGEIGMPLLAEAIGRNGSLARADRLADIPGLAWRLSNGELRQNPPAVVEDLDRMPLPAFDLIQWRHYQRKGVGSLALAAGRGCPSRCTYCAVNASTYHGFRQKSVHRVLTEIAAARSQTPLGFIDFEDEHLSADKAWLLDLLDCITGRFGSDSPELRAMNGLFAPSLDEEIVAAMAGAGFQTLNLALITTNQSQLKRFARPDTSADLDRVLVLARQHALSAVAYIIVAGPHQDPQSSVMDLLFLAQREVLAGVSVFYPAPGSADYEWCRQHQLLPSCPGLLRATTLPLAHATDRRQTVTLLRLGRILNFMKSLIDQGQNLPDPQPLAACKTEVQKMNRQQLGIQLLAAFLNDGTIYGCEENGALYPHQVDQNLVQTFRKGMGRITIKGSGAGR